MANIIYILTILQDILMCINFCLALIYSISILCIRRFRHRNNMFILNICLAIIYCVFYFVIYFTMYYFDLPRLLTSYMCIYLHFTYNIASISIPFTFVAYSVHRLCFIIYHTNPFFKTKRWVLICIVGEWIFVCLVSLPFVLRSGPYCSQTLRLRIYTCILAACLPLLINTGLNIVIFVHVRSSTQRIHPQSSSGNATAGNHHQSKISRRDIALLKQMAFMFIVFIIGWSPVYIIVILVNLGYNYLTIFYCLVNWAEFILILIILNLFKCNHELQEYFVNKFRQYIIRT